MVEKISIARKKELQQPDPFLESMNAALAWATAHKKQLTWAACAVVAIVLVLSGTLYSIHSSERTAADKLAGLQAAYTEAGDPEKGYAAVSQGFSELVEEYPNTAAGHVARARFADIAYRAGEYETAYTQYVKAIDDIGGDPAMKNLFRNAVAHTCQALGKNDEAITWYERVIDASSPLLKDEALFNLGLLYAEAGRDADSKKQFETIVAEYAQSPYAPMAEERVAMN